jgi:hypothetical protein
VPLRLLGQLAIDQGDLESAHELLTASLVAARDWGKAGWVSLRCWRTSRTWRWQRDSQLGPYVWPEQQLVCGNNARRSCNQLRQPGSKYGWNPHGAHLGRRRPRRLGPLAMQ